jgi:IS5 family transposase
VHLGNPSDTELLRPAIERITTQFDAIPASVTAAIERADAFVDMVKWRTGSEGRISLRNHAGVRVWCGHGGFGHNLVKRTERQQ